MLVRCTASIYFLALFSHSLHLFLILFFFLILSLLLHFFFFLNDTAPPEISPLPLHDALPISGTAAASTRLLGRCRPRVALIVSASRLTPSSIRPAATDENDRRSVPPPPPSTKNGAPGVNATPRSIATGRTSAPSSPGGSGRRSEKPPCGSVHVTSDGMRRSRAARRSARRRAYSRATRTA